MSGFWIPAGFFSCRILVALTFDKQKRGGVRSTLLLSGIEELWRIYQPPVQVRSKLFLTQTLELQKRSWLVEPLCWGSTTIICLFIPHALQCSNAIYYGTQHQSKVMEGSAAISATPHSQINSQLSQANVKRKSISARKHKQSGRRLTPAGRFALCSCAPLIYHLLCAAARQNVWKRLPGSLEIIRNRESPDF